MRIGIDARLWNETGVGRYIRNLITELQQIDTKNQYVLFVTPAASSNEVFNFTKAKASRWKLVETDIKWHSIEEQLLFYKVLENESLDLVHFPYFSIPVLYNQPYVITIHDLIINHFPTGKASTLPSLMYHLKRLGYKFILKQTAKKAQKIIAVSEATKREIQDHLPISEKKIAVIYEGVDPHLSIHTHSKNDLLHSLHSTQYLLYVGNAYPHKNIERMLRSFKNVLEKFPATKLVLVGKKNYFYQELEKYASTLSIEKSIIFTGIVSDEELGSLYKNAQAFVFPSLMEGFGLPGLEAMQQQCLVLASDIPVFKEIYKDAAIYFNPLDIDNMSDTMQKVLKNIEQYQAKKEKGMALAKQFSWKKMAEETVKVYESSVSLR